MKLRELERRLQAEPDNLDLRVTVAAALREAGRSADAVELYRSAAIAYRDRGQTSQAIVACQELLAIAPDDERGRALVAALAGEPISRKLPLPPPVAGAGADAGAGAAVAGPAVARTKTPQAAAMAKPDSGFEAEPTRRRSPSSMDETPLPPAVPYHVADPTKRLRKVSESDLPMSEDSPTRPGTEDGLLPEVSGIANAARRISATLIGAKPPMPTRRTDGPGGGARFDDDDDDQTQPRDLPMGVQRGRPARALTAREVNLESPLIAPAEGDEGVVVPAGRDRVPAGSEPGVPSLAAARGELAGAPVRGRGGVSGPTAQSLLASAFFAPLPVERRAGVLARFSRRSVPPGTVLIRQGEHAPALVLVASGRLDVKADRAGSPVALGVVGPGEHIGEAPLLSRMPARASVVAATEAELLLLSPRDFYEIAGANPGLWAALKASADRRTREHDAPR